MSGTIESRLNNAGSGGGSGNVSGPGSSTDTALASWNGTAGTTLRNNVVLLSSLGDLTAVRTITDNGGAPASTGFIRMSNGNAIDWRNHAGNGNLQLGVNASDQLIFNGSPIGGITGPGSSTNTAIAIWNGTNGLALSNTVVTMNNANGDTNFQGGNIQTTGQMNAGDMFTNTFLDFATSSNPGQSSPGHCTLYTSDGANLYFQDDTGVAQQIQTVAGSTGVFGPGSSINQEICTFSGTSGGSIAGSGVLAFLTSNVANLQTASSGYAQLTISTFSGQNIFLAAGSNGFVFSAANGSLQLTSGPLIIPYNAGAAQIQLAGGGGGALATIATDGAGYTSFSVNSGVCLQLTSNANVLVGFTIAAASNNGFAYIASYTGANPSGTPASFTGYSPILIETSNNAFWYYSSGAWRTIAGNSPGGSTGDIQFNNGSGGFSGASLLSVSLLGLFVNGNAIVLTDPTGKAGTIATPAPNAIMASVGSVPTWQTAVADGTYSGVTTIVVTNGVITSIS